MSDSADPPVVMRGTVVPGRAGRMPAVNVGDEWWSWEELGETLAEMLAADRPLDFRLTSEAAIPEPPALVVAPPDEEPMPRVSLFGDRPDAVVDGGDDRAEALALLADSLPETTRRSMPADELAAVATRVRAEIEAGDAPWALVAAAAGWEAGPPQDDADLWLDAAACLVSPRGDVPLGPDQMARLGAMEFDDWLATVIEVTRAGAGTPIDPDGLVALAARCMDVDSGAVDSHGAAVMRRAFEVILPVWQAVGAVDGDGLLTALGAWGLASALARAWGG